MRIIFNMLKLACKSILIIHERNIDSKSSASKQRRTRPEPEADCR